MEIGFVRQKIKLKNLTRMPTLQTEAQSTTSMLASFLAVGLGVLVRPLASQAPGAGVGDWAGKSSQDRSGGKRREEEVRATPSPRGKKNY